MSVIHCGRCGYDIAIPELSTDEKSMLLYLYRVGKSLSVVEQLRRVNGLDLAQAKAILDHLTPQSSQCHRCDFNTLAEGVSQCPKCKSVNLNW